MQVPSTLPTCLKVEVIEKLGTKIEKTEKVKKMVTKKKVIKVENPNKHKEKAKKKEVDNNMDFGNDDWGNGFSFDTEAADTKASAAITSSPPQSAKEQPTATQTQGGDDDDWNAFGNFFDDE